MRLHYRLLMDNMRSLLLIKLCDLLATVVADVLISIRKFSNINLATHLLEAELRGTIRKFCRLLGVSIDLSSFLMWCNQLRLLANLFSLFYLGWRMKNYLIDIGW